MPRALDRPLPPVKLHTDPALTTPIMRPVVAIGGIRQVLQYDDPEIIYDAAATAAGTSARVGTALVGHARVGRTS